MAMNPVLDSICELAMVNNDEVARTLERIGDLLEIKGENPYKVRAYRLAATQVENLGESLEEIARRERTLLGIEGIGPAIADKVSELLSTGRLGFLETLESEVPPTLLAVRELAGVGPRTAAMLWREAGISTLDELEAAALSGRLTGLPRLGPRSIERVQRALEQHRERAGVRRPRADVEPLAVELLEAVREIPGVAQAEVAGSFRRRREQVRDLDIVASTSAPATLIAAFAALPQIRLVLAKGDTKCSVEVRESLQVDCRAVNRDEFGAALQYFTGSAAHNVQLRGRALRMGLTLNEYGVFHVQTGARVAGDTEESIYEVLGLRCIPPEQREGKQEIQSAALEAHALQGRGRRPSTVEM
jgi:DNA polymerase (family X)